MESNGDLQKEVEFLRRQNKELFQLLNSERRISGGTYLSQKEASGGDITDGAGSLVQSASLSKNSPVSGASVETQWLQAGESILRLLLNLQQHPVVILTEDGIILYINSNGAEQFSSTIDKLEGCNIETLLADDSAQLSLFRTALTRNVAMKATIDDEGGEVEHFAAVARIGGARLVVLCTQKILSDEPFQSSFVQAQMVLAEQNAWHSAEIREQIRERLRVEGSLFCEQALLQAVLETDPNGICVFNADGSLRLMNRAMLSMLHVPECTPLTALAEHASLQAVVGDLSRRAFESGVKVTAERRVEDHLGTYRWFETVAVPLAYGEPEPSILFIAMEVTGRKLSELAVSQAYNELEERIKERTTALAELHEKLVLESKARSEQAKALAESEERYRSLFFANQAVKLLIRYDSGEIVEANQAAEKLYGITRQELLSKSIFEFYDVPDDVVRERMKRVREEGSLAFSTQQVMADGTPRYVEIYSGNIETDDAGLIFSIIHDITEKKITEQKLDAQRRHLDALLNASLHAALLVDVNGIIIAHNTVAVQLLTQTENNLVGKNIYRYILQDSVPVVKQTIERARIQRKPVRSTQEYGRRSWDVVWYPVVGADGEVVAMSIYAEDITDKKQAEARMRKLSSRVLSAQEDERKRIGRELHDSTAQTLSGIKFMVEAQLASMLKEAEKTSSTAVVEPWSKIVSVLQGAIVELRRIIMDLRPTVLDDLGVVSALRWLQQETMTVYPALQITVRSDVDEYAFTEAQKSVLFRIAQEALANIGKHSNADNVAVTLAADTDICSLIIEDDGQGFSSHNIHSGGIGLASMRERLELVNGALYLGRSSLGGAEVQAVIPLYR